MEWPAFTTDRSAAGFENVANCLGFIDSKRPGGHGILYGEAYVLARLSMYKGQPEFSAIIFDYNL